MKTVGVTGHTNQKPSKQFMEKMSKFKTPKNEKQSMKYVQNTMVHIFNVWSITMQSLNKKEWKLSELQITQTRHPLHISDGKNV